MKHTLTQSSLAAALALLAVLATACGTDGTAEAAGGVVEIPSRDSVVDAPPATDPETGHEYGATLGEWTELELDQAESAPTELATTFDLGRSAYPEIMWDDLIPPGASSDDLFAEFEERLNAAERGSEEMNALYNELDAKFDPEAVNTDLDGQRIRLAGFVAPLTYEDDIVTEFLLVPTFGACIHVPPPPPNQTVMVSADKDDGLTVDESWGAVWVEGTIVIEPGTADLGASSYRIVDVKTGPYT